MAGSNYLDVLLAQQGGGRSFLGDVGAINDAAAKRKRESAADQLLRSTLERANQEAEQARIDEALAGVEADKREALREQVAKTPNAVVVNGVVYSGANAGQQAHEDALRQRARDKAAEQNQDKLKLLTLERDRQLKEINDKKKGFAAGLKGMGLEEGDITPQMIETAQGNLDKVASDIEAQYQQAVAASQRPGAAADPNAAKMLEGLKVQRDQAKELSDKLRGVSESYGTAEKEFHQGVDAESKDLLEQFLIDNPFQAPSDPRRFDRFREQSIQRSMPDLLTAAKVDPAGAKLIMDQYKLDSKQGDSAIEAERKTYNADKKNFTTLLSRYKSLESNSARLAAEKSKFEAMLEQRKAELAEKRRKREAVSASDEDDREVKLILGALSSVTSKQNNNTRALASTISAIGKDIYTPQGIAYAGQVGGLFPNSANAANVQSVLRDVLRMAGAKEAQSAENDPKTFTTVDGAPPLLGPPKKELTTKKEGKTAELPPVLTTDEKKKAKAKKVRAVKFDSDTKAIYEKGVAKGLVKKSLNADGTVTYTMKDGESFTGN